MAIPAIPHLVGVTAADGTRPVVCTHPSVGAVGGNWDTNWSALGIFPVRRYTADGPISDENQLAVLETGAVNMTWASTTLDRKIQILRTGAVAATVVHASLEWRSTEGTTTDRTITINEPLKVAGVLVGPSDISVFPDSLTPGIPVVGGVGWPVYSNPATPVSGVLDTMYGKVGGKEVYKAIIIWDFGNTSTQTTFFGPNPMLEKAVQGYVRVSSIEWAENITEMNNGNVVFPYTQSAAVISNIENFGARWLRQNAGGWSPSRVIRAHMYWTKD